jgi:hypothetical protein
MSSDKRIEASRQNGRKGGVKTLEGKRRSSKNAEKFGFYSKQLPVLGTESQYLFDQFRTGFFKQYKPVGPAEVELVESLADYSWRIRRFRLTSTWLLDKKMVEQAEQNEIDHPNLDHGARVALAMEALLLQADGFDKLARYEARLERTRDRILRALVRTQQDRLLENGARIAKQQNEPRTPAESTQAVAAPDDFPCENWTPLPFHPDDVPFDMPQPDCYVPPRAFQKARAA